MKKIFNYNKSNLNETQQNLVEKFGMLCDKYMEGKSATPEYLAANKEFNEAFMKDCYAARPDADVEHFNVEMLKNPMENSNLFFINRFETLLAQMITPVVPTVIASGFENLYDVTQVGWGK